MIPYADLEPIVRDAAFRCLALGLPLSRTNLHQHGARASWRRVRVVLLKLLALGVVPDDPARVVARPRPVDPGPQRAAIRDYRAAWRRIQHLQSRCEM